MTDAKNDDGMDQESKSGFLTRFNVSKSKLKIATAVLYLISTTYVVLSTLEATRYTVKEVFSESNAIVLLMIMATFSAIITFYILSYIPLWIAIALYHIINTIVPLAFWVILRLLGWAIFVIISIYLVARFVLGVSDPIQYVFDLYAFLDLFPSMLLVRFEAHGGFWKYVEGWYS